MNIYLNGQLTQTYNFLMSGEDNNYYVAESTGLPVDRALQWIVRLP